jgi:hypothetical protein
MVSSWELEEPTECKTVTGKDNDRTAREFKVMMGEDGDFAPDGARDYPRLDEKAESAARNCNSG